MERTLQRLCMVVWSMLLLCMLSSVGGTSKDSRGVLTFDWRNITEGGNLSVECNVTVIPPGQLYWTGPEGLREYNKQLSILNVTRSQYGIYTCVAFNITKAEPADEKNLKRVIYSFYLDVLYPAKILSVNTSKKELHKGDSFDLRVQVEGNPLPTTTLESSFGERKWFEKEGEGSFNITIPSLNCTDTGEYVLTCKNTLQTDTVRERISVLCPPDPVTNLTVSDVAVYSANLSFITGNGYDHIQTFYIMRDVDGNLTDLQRKMNDTPNDTGGKHVFLVISSLNESTPYSLTVLSGNSYGNATHLPDSVSFSTYGKPKPNPKFPVKTTFKPRLGDAVTLTIHALGLPVPTFQWWHNGESVNSTDDNYTSTVAFTDIVVNNFGEYTLNMTNNFGVYTVTYEVLADGPPEPVSHLHVLDVNSTCAHLNFTTGYNYNSTQTFIIERYTRGNMTELTRCKDLTSGRGGEPFTCIICGLLEDTLYNVTVVSNNSRGQSPKIPDPVKFSTYGKPKPDPEHVSNTTFKPRLGDTVTLSIQAVGYPPPKYNWLHDGEPVESSDTNYSSTVHIANITVKEFGKYTLNMSNEVGYFEKIYEILAEGPPAPVSDLKISAVTTTTANLSFVTGYDYNKTQTFVVTRYQNGKVTELISVNDTHPDPGDLTVSVVMNGLLTNTDYNITVVSKNSNGTSSPDFISFMTEGIPEPDPKSRDVNTTRPRLGSSTKFQVHAIGNPLPVIFFWRHNNKELLHNDTGLITTVIIQNVTEDDFGDYILNMRNKIGEKNYTFTVKADGPPDAVTMLSSEDVTADSVELKWKAGFAYGSEQSFEIKGTVNNKELDMTDIADKTDGKGGMESFKLENLESSSDYSIYLVAKNEKGPASKSNSVSFTTKGKGTTTAEYVGYVVGGIGAVVFIIVIISIIRCYRKRRNEVPYEEIPGEQDEDVQRQPHLYRYDDAAAPHSDI